MNNDRAPCCTAEWPYCLSLYFGIDFNAHAQIHVRIAYLSFVMTWNHFADKAESQLISTSIFEQACRNIS